MDEKQEVEISAFSVYFGQIFIDHYDNFPSSDKDKIDNFVYHIEENGGFEGLPGRNKRSDDVPKDDPEFLRKVKYAQEHGLWHYHIGIPYYDESRPFGDKTSEYVIHYTLKGSEVLIVDLGYHPPLKLPTEKYLK